MELRGTNLVLHDVDKADEGEYDCEIETDRSDPITIRHSIEILIPPTGSIDILPVNCIWGNWSSPLQEFPKLNKPRPTQKHESKQFVLIYIYHVF